MAAFNGEAWKNRAAGALRRTVVDNSCDERVAEARGRNAISDDKRKNKGEKSFKKSINWTIEYERKGK